VGRVEKGWNRVTLSGTHTVSVTWAPHRKPIWAYCVGLIMDMSGLSGNGPEVEKLCGPHVGSVTWAQHGKPMWAYFMGPTRDLIGQSRHVELDNNNCDSCCFSQNILN